MAYHASAVNPNEHHQPQMPQSTRMALDSIIDLPKENSAEEAEFFKLQSKQIPRFPCNLQRIGRERDYIAPRTVSIGPYYNGVPTLQPMEKVKRTFVNCFFEGLAQSRDATYEKIKSIACDARSCYTDEDALEGMTDDKFAEIMFIDGCFLVQFMDNIISGHGGASLKCIINPHVKGVWRDMILLENQIPWAVMEVLLPLKSLTMEHIIRFLVKPSLHGTVQTDQLVIDVGVDKKPGHLLCFAQFCEAASKRVTRPSFSSDILPVYTSTAELAEMGIKLEASQKVQFSAMNLVKGPLFAKLSLEPLCLDAIICCWLVNMAAFEMRVETGWEHDCSVNSYLGVLSLLMNREEDVRELHAKGILYGLSSDQQTHEFFNDLAPDLVPGLAYLRLITDLVEYKRKRRVWIAIYRFIYKNAEAITKVMSIIGVLAGIFRALYFLRH